MTILITIVLGTLGSILAAEVSGVCPALSRRLLVRAARRLPEGVRDRYIAEWHGDLDYLRANRGGVSVLLWALGVYVSSYRLAKVAQAQAPAMPADQAETELSGAGGNGGTYEIPSARFAPYDTFYEYLLETAFSHRIWQVVRHALTQIGHDPQANQMVRLNDVVVYIKHVPSAVVREEHLPALLLAYTFEHSENVVRPFFVSTASSAMTATDGIVDGDDESKSRQISRALSRVARHREH